MRFGFSLKNSEEDPRKVKEGAGLVAIFEIRLGKVKV